MDILSSSSGRTYKTDLHYIIKVSRVCHQQPSEKTLPGLDQTAAGTRTLSEFIKRPETSTALCFLKAEGLFVFGKNCLPGTARWQKGAEEVVLLKGCVNFVEYLRLPHSCDFLYRRKYTQGTFAIT